MSIIKLTNVPSRGEKITITYPDGGEVEVENVEAAARELGLEEEWVRENLTDDPSVPDFKYLEIEEDDAKEEEEEGKANEPDEEEGDKA